MTRRIACAVLLAAAAFLPAISFAQRPAPGMGGAQHDALRAALALPDGGWLLAGQLDRGSEDDPLHGGSAGFVQRHDRMGRLLWRTRFDTAGADSVEALAIDAQSRIVVAGHTTGSFPGWQSSGGSDAFVARLDGAGEPLDLLQFGDARDQRPRAIDAFPDGGIAVGGYDDLELAGSAVIDWENGFVAVVSEAPAGGLRLASWLRSNAPPSDFVLAVAAAQGGSGDLLLASTMPASRVLGGGIQIYRVGQDGSERWGRQLSDHGFDAATRLLTAPDGSVLLAGVTVSPLGGPASGDSDPVLVALDPASGETRWARRMPLGDGTWVSDLALINGELVLSGLADRLPETPQQPPLSYPFALHFNLKGEPTDAWLGPLLDSAALRIEVFSLPGGRRGGPRVGFSALPASGLPTAGGFDYFALPRRAFGRP